MEKDVNNKLSEKDIDIRLLEKLSSMTKYEIKSLEDEYERNYKYLQNIEDQLKIKNYILNTIKNRSLNYKRFT